MKKVLAVVLSLLMIAALFAGCAKKPAETEASTAADAAPAAAAGSDLEAVMAAGKLVVGITDYEPMDYHDLETGEWTGFDAEFATFVAQKLGVVVEFVEIDWDNKFLELNAKSIDVIWNGMTITDEVKLNCDVSVPYAQNKQIVVMAADKVADYQNVESLKGLKFAVEAGSAGEACAKDNELNYTSVTAQTNALLEVQSGASDACIIDSTMADAMTGEGTDYADLAAGIYLQEEEYGIGFRKGSDLVDKVNGYINELAADGTLATLSAKYPVALADSLNAAAVQ